METVIILAIVMLVWQSKFVVMNFNFISCALRKISSKNCALAFMIFGTTILRTDFSLCKWLIKNQFHSRY